MDDRGRRRWPVVLVALLGAVCLTLVGILAWRFLPWPSRQQSGAEQQELVELWDAYQRARRAARAQARDSQLVSASTEWQGLDEESMLAGTGMWAFVFYTDADQAVLDIGASAGGATTPIQTRVWIAPAIVQEGAWQEGPRDSLLVFLAYGGRAFLAEHPQALVDLHLGAGEGGRPIWAITALNTGGGDLLSLAIDAATMQVVSVSP